MSEWTVIIALCGFIVGWIGSEIYEFYKRRDRWH